MQDELSRVTAEKTSDYKTVVANINTILKAYEKGYRSVSENTEIPKFFSKNYSTKIRAELES